MHAAVLHDGTRLPVTVAGRGPALLVSLGLTPASGNTARTMLAEGLDTQPGRTLLAALSVHFTVVAFDYEAHRIQHPAPKTLTPEAISSDLLAVADATGTASFAYYGYSWLGIAGIRLAMVSDRVSALAVGGFPPVDAPFEALWRLSVQAHRAAVGRSQATNPATSASFLRPGELVQPVGEEERALLPMRAAQARQFVTLFRHLKDDDGAPPSVPCPALCFAGSEDVVAGLDGQISMAAPLRKRRGELENLGWGVEVLEGLDQVDAMQPGVVLDVVVPWLRRQVGETSKSRVARKASDN